MITPGENWISYIGVPDEYPDFIELALEVNDAMWDAALDVFNERLAANPVLRAMRDARYQLWTQVDVPVGSLPPGIRISYCDGGRMADGVTGKPRPDRFHPQVYADVDWEGDYHRGDRCPSLTLDTVVQAWLPVPLDVSALIALVAAEGNQDVPPPPRKRRPRPEVEWSGYDVCTRPGCFAAAGAACCDIRSVWSSRRRSSRPHPGRPRLADRQLETANVAPPASASNSSAVDGG